MHLTKARRDDRSSFNNQVQSCSHQVHRHWSDRPTIHSEDQQWYAVRCVLQLPADAGFAYEERITLWRATSAEDAIEQAELEASRYVDGMDFKYMKLAQPFHLFEPPDHGKEVFSLIRESDLPPNDYLSAFFDTGRESQGHIKSEN